MTSHCKSCTSAMGVQFAALGSSVCAPVLHVLECEGGSVRPRHLGIGPRPAVAWSSSANTTGCAVPIQVQDTCCDIRGCVEQALPDSPVHTGLFTTQAHKHVFPSFPRAASPTQFL